MILRSPRERPRDEGVSAGTGEPIGAILAGGFGRRIGGAKAVVQLCGRPLVCYPLQALQAALPEVMLLAKADTKLPSLRGVTVWVESDPRRHPLVGILEALSVASGRSIVVCAADLPLITPGLIARLATVAVGEAPAVVVRCQQVVQPLLGLYTPAAGPLLGRALAGGDPRLLDAVESIGSRYLEVDDPELLFNVNAPEDLLQAAAIIDSRR